LTSIDNHSKMPGDVDPVALDRELRAALSLFGLAERVTLLVADANTVAPAPDGYDLVFLDGDHSYEGVRRDLDRWGRALVPGGSLLLHDAGDLRPMTTLHEGVQRLARELRAEGGRYRFLGGAGSLLHFGIEKA
jgi:predicted O-methyltransferase YrrM